MTDGTPRDADALVREPPAIPPESLYACLRDEYALEPASLEFLPRGRDYDAGVFRVVDARGTTYLLKVTTRPLYAPSYLVPRYLSEQGIASVVAPVPTASGALWVTLGAWRATVYPFVDGDTTWAGMTSAHWRETGRIFRRIHETRPPLEHLEALGSPRRETFDPSGYLRWVREFEARLYPRSPARSAAVSALAAAWMAHQPEIHAMLATLEALAAPLMAQAVPYVICHADLHAANLLRDADGGVFVIDWDEVMLAPKERDFIFVRESPSDAFWDGYGACAVDWLARTYFQYERVVQDVIEDARQISSREDLGEAIKFDMLGAFEQSFAPGGNLGAAHAAAAHLPPNIGIPRGWDADRHL